VPSRLVHHYRRVLSWFDEDRFRRLFVNAGRLLTASGIAAFVGLLATALTARALGPEGYGILALTLAYQLTIGKLVTFDAWQAIIKFGSEALERGDRQALRQLIKFGFCLDIGSAVVGTVLAVALAGPVISLLGWDQSVRSLLVLYSLLILFSFSGTPIGVLRLFDRFDLLSYAAIVNAVLRLVGVLWCLLVRHSLYDFVLVYLITGVVGQLYQIVVSLGVLRTQNMGDIAREPLQGIRRRFPGIVDYVWTTNLAMTVRMLSREADELIIAGLTTPAALGLFRVAKMYARILPQLADPLSQAIYPELARAWARGDRRRFVSLIKRATLFTIAAAFSGWFVFVMLGPWVIRLTVGPAFQDAYGVAVLYMLAMVVFLCSFAFTPALLAMGLTRRSFFANLAATVVYFGLLFPFVRWVGIAGASLAYVGFFLSWALLMAFWLSASLRTAPGSFHAACRT
jgi:O-antigen/teichoic acid export membrane protein